MIHTIKEELKMRKGMKEEEKTERLMMKKKVINKHKKEAMEELKSKFKR